MNKRITIREIAAEAGVSTGTVHRAIHGKPGVGDLLRQRILDLCVLRGYQANTVAAALKRGPLRVVAAFPVPDGKGYSVFPSVWQGFRRCMDELVDYNIELVELYYHEAVGDGQATELMECLMRYDGAIDALITIGHFNTAAREAVRSYTQRGIPVFLVCDDADHCARLACVQANHDLTGRMVGELLSSQIPAGRSILLCAGDVLAASHTQTAQGFCDYLHEHCPKTNIITLYGYDNETDLRDRLRKELEDNETLAAAYSVSARVSVFLADEAVRLGVTSRVRIVVSQLFRETIQAIEQGQVKNIVFKDPEQQAYQATRLMSDFLLKGRKPIPEVQFVESRLVFQSSLPMYVR